MYVLYEFVHWSARRHRKKIRVSHIAWDVALCVRALCTEYTEWSCYSHLLALECFKIAWVFKLARCICPLKRKKLQKTSPFRVCVDTELSSFARLLANLDCFKIDWMFKLARHKNPYKWWTFVRMQQWPNRASDKSVSCPKLFTCWPQPSGSPYCLNCWLHI